MDQEHREQEHAAGEPHHAGDDGGPHADCAEDQPGRDLDRSLRRGARASAARRSVASKRREGIRPRPRGSCGAMQRPLEETVAALETRLAHLEAEAEIRRLKARYGALVDARYGKDGPRPRAEIEPLAREIAELFT